MAVPTPVQASTGLALTTGTGTVTATSCVAGNVIVLHTVSRGTSDDFSRGTITNIETLDGTDGDFEHVSGGIPIGSPTSSTATISIGRVIANGSCSAEIVTGGSGEDTFSVLYEFSGVDTGTTLADVIQNDGAVDDQWGNSVDTGTAVSSDDVTTTVSDTLVCNFVGLTTNQAVGSFTGETGGDLSEAFAEFASGTGATATLQLQTAQMASAGTIAGGSITVSSTAAGVIGWAFIGDVDAPTVYWIGA